MSKTFTLYGWELSYFSGKVRSYLQYKQVPFVETPVDLLTLTRTIPAKTGAMVMPVVVTPEGEWLQDSSVIIDRMEARFPVRGVLPAAAVPRFAALVLEAWADEFWIPFAMHTRWSYPENLALFTSDAGRALLPWAPAFLQRQVAGIPVRAMRKHLPGVGVVPAQFAVMNEWLRITLDALDAHFSQSPFLLGEQISLADFALYGPLYAHLGRDPWPRRELIAPRRQVAGWIDRLKNAAQIADTSSATHHRLPASLDAIFQPLFREFLPMVTATLAQVHAALPSLRHGKALPRGLGEIEFPLAHGRFRRAALPYTLWMVQRSLDGFAAMTAEEQRGVRDWLRTQGGEAWLALDIPRLRRVALRVAPEVR